MTTLPEDTKSAIKEMIEIDSAIDKITTALKKYKERKDLLQKKIQSQMIKNEINTISLPGGVKLQTYVRKSRATCSKDWISQRLTEYCDANRVNYNELYDFIYNPKYRPQIEKQTIKKTKPRKSKK